ncbi:MAG: TonB-dependent receptor plug domain-containing protein [Hyphomonadaceae bacterium]
MTKTVKRAERVSHWVAGLLLGVSPFAFAPDAHAQTDGASLAGEARIEYNIPAQPLSSALALYAQQSGLSTLVPADRFAGQFAPAVRGRFTREEALSRLLSGSNLRGEITPANTLALEQDQSPQPGRANAETRVRAEANSNAEADEEIVVTGTRIRGAAPVGSNVVTIDRAEIEQSGLSTTEELVRTLPQVFNGGFAQHISFQNGNIGGGSGLNLRGLGADATLTLVNGRRLPVMGLRGNFTDIFIAVRRLGSLLWVHANCLRQIELDAITRRLQSRARDREHVWMQHKLLCRRRLVEKPSDARRLPSIKITHAPWRGQQMRPELSSDRSRFRAAYGFW